VSGRRGGTVEPIKDAKDEAKWKIMVAMACQRECHPAFKAFSAEQRAIIWAEKSRTDLRSERDALLKNTNLASLESEELAHYRSRADALREAVEWALENGDVIVIYGADEPRGNWKEELRRRADAALKGGKG